jgi:hypothetical protein
MLLAFINPSGPTREPQELAVLLNDIALISGSAQHEATRALW